MLYIYIYRERERWMDNIGVNMVLIIPLTASYMAWTKSVPLAKCLLTPSNMIITRVIRVIRYICMNITRDVPSTYTRGC